MYRVIHLVVGCVNLNFECSTVCPILPGLMVIWQKCQFCLERWWNIKIKINPTQVHNQTKKQSTRTSV